MFSRFLAAVIATTFTAVPAGAVIVIDTTIRDAAFTVSATDLLETSAASIVGTGPFSREGERGVAALTDGSFGPLGNPTRASRDHGAATADGGNTLTYVLDRAYHLTSIATYAGWDEFRGGQSYTVSYATSAAPSTFVTLASEYNNASRGGNVATRAVITGSSNFLATDVTALRFAFGGDLLYGYAGYRELDVFGTAVPEPGGWMMMIAGFGLVGAAARRRSVGVTA